MPATTTQHRPSLNPHTPPTPRRPRGQDPGPHGIQPRGPGTVPAADGISGHCAPAGGRRPPWGGPLPPAPTRRQATPAALLRDLAAALAGHGFERLYGTASPTEGVLSVAYGITVWTNGHTLRCHTLTDTIGLPTSTHAAARQLADLINPAPLPGPAGGPDPRQPEARAAGGPPPPPPGPGNQR